MRVPDEITDCAAFVGVLELSNDLSFMPTGTAFFFTMTPSPPFSYNASYLITARHVVTGTALNSMDGKIHIRVNRREGGTTAIETSPSQWFFHPTDAKVDVAVLPLHFSQSPFRLRHIPDYMVATREIIESEGIGIGDEIFMTGLFINHAGQNMNIPILRIGNIAMMAGEPLESGEEVILIEARSIGGLSGSPAFVNISGVRRGEVHPGEENCVYLLGVVVGHWEGGLEADIATQDHLVNRGIGIVVPATKVMEVLTQDGLATKRHELERIIRASNAPERD